jgi:alpha-beta hydrolase superfamily lysophospholipase
MTKRFKECFQIVYIVLISLLGFGSISCRVTCDKNNDWHCEYGSVVSRDHDWIKKEVVEQVRLFPKAAVASDATIERKGMLVRYPDAVGTILICHGFMCDKFDVGFLRHIFPRKKFNFMTFDFRAHGENREGQFCTFGKDEALDVQAAARFLRQHPDLKDKPLFVYGFSMGAVASIEAQAQDSTLFDAMILDCPFDSSKNLIRKGLSNMKLNVFGYEIDIPGRSTLEKHAFHPYVQLFLKTLLKAISKMDTKNVMTNISMVSPIKSVKSIETPCFLIHCKSDELVSVDAITKMFGRMKGYKMLWLTDGRRHFDSVFYNTERYAQKIKAFLKSNVEGTLNKDLDGIIIEDNDDKEVIRRLNSLEKGL